MAVIDASVAVRWYVDGSGQEFAATWLGLHDLLAPDLICAEVGNALWRYMRHGSVEFDDAVAVLDALPANFARLVPTADLVAEAFKLGAGADHPVYDCVYLALARREQTTLVTLDRKLAMLAQKLGILTATVPK